MSEVNNLEKPPPTMIQTDDYIAPARWGTDHWSTLLYLEQKIVNFGDTCVVGIDPHMRTNRRHIRVFSEARAYMDTHAKRYTNARGVISMDPSHGTRLNDNTWVQGHDDWMCVQDMAHSGLLTITAAQMQPKKKFKLSALGMEVAALLRAHKAAGGNYVTFRWQPSEVAA